MKQILLVIIGFALWVLYFFITINARNRYLYGQIKGVHCVAAKEDLFGADCTFDRSRKPEREYATWREFWAVFNKKKKIKEPQ